MHRDDIEKFIEDNRNEFDSIEEFNQELVWAKIESGLFAYTIYNQNTNFETLAGLTNEQEIKRDEMIRFVSVKEQEVKEQNIDLNKYEDFKRELDGLDEIEKIVMDDFAKSVNKEKMVKSMLQYYESKARILELILMETEKNKKNETFDNRIY